MNKIIKKKKKMIVFVCGMCLPVWYDSLVRGYESYLGSLVAALVIALQEMIGYNILRAYH